MPSVHWPYNSLEVTSCKQVIGNWEQLFETDQSPNLIGVCALTTDGGQMIAQLLIDSHILLCCHWFHSVAHLHSPLLLCVQSLGSPWYDYVYFTSALSSIQWDVSLLQWLTKLSVLNVSHYATINNKTSVKLNRRCFKNGSMIGRIESVRVQSD